MKKPNIKMVLPLMLAVLTSIGFVPLNASAALPIFDNPLPAMLKKTVPAVVNISTRTRISYEENPLYRDPFFRHFFNIPDMPKERVQQSLGSGVIVNADKGYVITNHHVIHKADKITVNLHDSRTLDATLIGSDPATDIALIKIKDPNLTQLTLGDSDTLEVGDIVVAIGSPFGLGQTVTSGIISALGRSSLGIEGYEDFIQTDASINPGNSGGALVNINGQLIGINTAIVGPTGGNVGIGFAIPVNMVKTVIDQIVQYGDIQRGQLGIQIQDLTPELARAFDITYRQGAVVAGVMQNSAAERAGIKRGDVIIAVDHRKVTSASKLRNMVAMLRVGDKIKLEIIREGRQKTINARIAKPYTRIPRF